MHVHGQTGAPLRSRRTKAAATVVVAAALANGAESIGMRWLLPPKPDSRPEMLELVAANTATFTALMVVGTLAIPLMAGAFWHLTRMARPGSPRLASTARVLLLAGMWGFLGLHVVALAQVPLSGLGSDAGAVALEAVETSPVFGLVFLAPFLLGTPLGLLVLVVALLRGSAPKWIPLSMLAFLVVDFGLRNPGPVDAHWLWIAASLGAAVHLVRPRAESTKAAREPVRTAAAEA